MKRIRLSVLVVLILLAAAAAFRGLGRWLDREDPLSHADVIFVVSGAMPQRALEGGKVFAMGYAPEVWLSRPESPADGLAKLVLTMYAAQIIFVTVVLGSVMMLFRIPAAAFIRAVREPFLIAFSTASSEAALPRALENMEQFGVPKHIVAFVLQANNVSVGKDELKDNAATLKRLKISGK